ncbi:MAG: RdgB/HAM1 family non-canonical purine NTP pyrophosphatase [Bacteroidia bacterium]|nr:RdgB/HAM1 family non-canonical purine NTP pyrophosphatase [Bacteroidia bacterium]
MPTKILFGTNNKDKLKEIQELVGQKFHILSLRDIELDMDVEETEDTLEGNATLKAKSFYAAAGIPCFSDDTGLEVDALDGRPGVYSARYAGENCSYQDNVDKMLREMADKSERTARFRTVISFFDGENLHTFEGKVEGEISREEKGKGGFGYDPLFVPLEHDKSFAEMSPEEKNAISHRGKAVREFAAFLNEQIND